MARRRSAALRLADQQKPADMIGNREGKTTLTVAKREVSLEIGRPSLVGRCGLTQRISPCRRAIQEAALLHQPRTLEPFTGGADGRSAQVWIILIEDMHQLFSPPTVMLALAGDQSFEDFITDVMSVCMGPPGKLLESVSAQRGITRQPLIRRKTADSVVTGQLAFRIGVR